MSPDWAVMTLLIFAGGAGDVSFKSQRRPEQKKKKEKKISKFCRGTARPAAGRRGSKKEKGGPDADVVKMAIGKVPRLLRAEPSLLLYHRQQQEPRLIQLAGLIIPTDQWLRLSRKVGA